MTKKQVLFIPKKLKSIVPYKKNSFSLQKMLRKKVSKVTLESYLKNLFVKNNFKKNLKRIFQYWVWKQQNNKRKLSSIKKFWLRKTFLNKLQPKIKYLNYLINLKFDFRRIYGIILSIKDGVAKIIGLQKVKSGEMVYLGLINYSLQSPNGMVLSLNKGYISVACFDGGVSTLKCGDRVFRTFRLISIPFSLSLFGRTLDPLGVPLDGLYSLQSNLFLEIDTKAVGIIPRESVKEPMQTGVLAVDALTPIGCGQRELLIGDRQTGKTSLALDSISTQLFYNGRCYCIYVGIGQKKASVAKINDFFFGLNSIYKTKALKRLLIISSSSSDSAVLQFLAPYTGCSVGEWLSKKGGHALVIYDDLSKQAIAYRQMSLLLRRPPGREAYPGDVFYLHSRLLERSAKLSIVRGGGSLTSLPIIETQAGDVSAYIPTNVISITDGQIFLETKLFNEGIRPAINVGLSVSRIGSAAQTKGMKQVAGRLKLELAQYREIESFASFAAELDLATQKVLNRGVKLVFIIKQQNKHILSVEKQVLLLFAAMNGFFDGLLQKELEKFKGYILNFLIFSTFLNNFFVTNILERDSLVNILTLFLKIS